MKGTGAPPPHLEPGFAVWVRDGRSKKAGVVKGGHPNAKGEWIVCVGFVGQPHVEWYRKAAGVEPREVGR